MACRRGGTFGTFSWRQVLPRQSDESQETPSFTLTYAVVMGVTTFQLHRYLEPLPSHDRMPLSRISSFRDRLTDCLVMFLCGGVVGAAVTVAAAAAAAATAAAVGAVAVAAVGAVAAAVAAAVAVGWRRSSLERRADEGEQRDRDGNPVRSVRGSCVPLPPRHGARTIQRKPPRNGLCLAKQSRRRRR